MESPDDPPENRPSGDEGAGFPQSFRLQIARWVEHFLHTRTTARTFVTDEYDIAGDDFIAEDALHRRVLTFEDPRRAGKDQDGLVDARGLHDAAVFGEVAIEHREAAVFGEGMGRGADDAFLAVEVDRTRSGAPG